MKKLLENLRGFMHGIFLDHRLSVVIDPRDNSITFNKPLVRRIRPLSLNETKVFAFFVPESQNYAFAINPELDRPTQQADIMINTKLGCVGFESLNPTVARICFSYGLPFNAPCRLSVRRRSIKNMYFYEILRPRT